jgi:uncharacterized phage protein gp47/JayE
MIGITDNGFAVETLDEIRDDMANKLSSRWSTEIARSDVSAIWHLLTIIAERYADLQELAEAVYRSYSRETATGDGLVGVNMLTGTNPLPTTASTVTLTLTGNAGVTIPALSRVSDDALVEFETDDDAVTVAIGARVELTAYILGARRHSGGNVYVVTIAGTTAAGAGPTSGDTGDAVTDGSVTWRYIGEGVACVDVEATCTAVGPTDALSGALIEIETPISGWLGVMNLLDADLGAFKETDESYRLRGQAELAGAGSHTNAAIVADLGRVDGVTSVKVLENRTDYTADTMPPHTVEALVRGGESEDIAQVLLDTGIGVGYSTFGNQTVVVTDNLGVDYSIKFSRPVEIPVYVVMNVTVDASEFPDDGADAIEAAITAWGDAQQSGKDAVANAIGARAFSVAGVLDVTATYIGTAPAPVVSTTIAVGTRELATYDTSRITINVTPGTP